MAIETILLEVSSKLEDGFLVAASLQRTFPDLSFSYIEKENKVILCSDEEPDPQLVAGLRNILGSG